jgi:hypothetical protein
MERNYKLLATSLIAFSFNLVNAQCPVPSSVTASPTSLCAGASTSLNATATGATISWFNVPTAGTSLGTSGSGANIAFTPTATTTYYAESFNIGGVVTFSYTGALQNYTVPVGVTSVTVDAYGASGHGLLGYGGRVQAIYPVTPGTVLQINVGGAGTAISGGFNGGGNGSGSSSYGSGGGASDIRLTPYALANRVIVAGGGGGSGSNCGTHTAEGGDGGGLIGISGCVYSCSSCQYTGAGGTQSAGGIAGPTAHSNCGGNQNGLFGQGGSNLGGSGTGGGGGYYGGGSGCYEGAGGGSSYTAPSATSVIHTQGVRIGNGLITLTLGNACTSISRTAITVSVNAIPTVSVTSGAVCAGNSYTMVASGAGSYTYTGGSAVVTPTANTSYSVTGTSAFGCVASNTAVSTVTVNANPSVVASTSNTLICSGESVVLTASTSATSYTWNTGATTMSVSVSPTVTSTYTVNVSNAAACVASSTVLITVNACVGINEILANSISVYPNPNNGILNINLTSELSKNSSLEIYDALGKLVSKHTLANELNTLNISALTNGVYTFKVLNNSKLVKIGKLVKQ